MISSIMAAALTLCAAPDSTITLQGITVTGKSQRDFQMKTSQTSVQISRDYLDTHFSGSLMQSLEGIPGVKAMAIGSGQSKPAIRGLGFNRLAVTEDGIKHEGQQWGDDHGLEIDQFAIDRAEVIKGPAALLHGSDAIGGVLSLYANHIPTSSFTGAVQLFARSVSESLGLSAKVGGRKGNFFYRANMTVVDYADYRVPTDSIQYYSYYIRLKDRRLRNTAGMERSGGATLGYAGYRFHTDLRISDNYSKSGFFANAHGLEVRLSSIDYDHSRRDVDLPYQWVNHLKVLSHTSWHNDLSATDLSLAYQRNLREERSEPVSHGYMPLPENSLERRFDKHTYTGKLATRLTLGESHTLSAGLSAEHQHNRRGGWGFILPDFETTSGGAYVMDRYALSERFILNGGVRYDLARVHIHSYHDWYMTPESGETTGRAADGGTTAVYKERSSELTRRFHSFTWSLGANYAVGEWVIKANVGKSFRVPIAKELGADGINYHIFRYERGNSTLDPEESYQVDATLLWTNDMLSLQFEPYVNYFPNYIYLNPTAQYAEGLQLYHYTQAEVLRWGFEAQADCRLDEHWETSLKGEYLYARQQSGQKKGYGLPFSTPWSVDADVKYSFGHEGYAGVNVHVVGAQKEIVPPEKPTDGYWTLNASCGKHFVVASLKLHASLHASNLLGKRYYDHTSYYRLIDVPEPGRNVSLMLGIEF